MVRVVSWNWRGGEEMNAIFGAGEGERVRDGDIGSDERGGRGGGAASDESDWLMRTKLIERVEVSAVW